MCFISFFYYVKDEPERRYGKILLSYISDDHEGLDKEAEYFLLSGLNAKRSLLHQPKLKRDDIRIGILSFSSHKCIPTYSSDKEKSVFDFYCLSAVSYTHLTLPTIYSV